MNTVKDDKVESKVENDFDRWYASLVKPNPYKKTIDIITAFEGHVTAIDADNSWWNVFSTDRMSGWDAFAEWAETEAVRNWVKEVAHVDMATVPTTRKDYFMAPFWVAYHRTIEIVADSIKLQNASKAK